MPCSMGRRYGSRAEITAQQPSATGAVAMPGNGKFPSNKWWRIPLRPAPPATVRTFIPSHPLDSGGAGIVVDGGDVAEERGDTMPFGFGGRGGYRFFGRSAGRGRGGFGFGARGGGWGFGFRGSSPPWPYVGRGRGGLPRCAYYWDTSATPYDQVPYSAYATPSASSQMKREQELDFLRNKAEMLKRQLEDIDARTRDLETRG
jgi:hypothetical protein